MDIPELTDAFYANINQNEALTATAVTVEEEAPSDDTNDFLVYTVEVVNPIAGTEEDELTRTQEDEILLGIASALRAVSDDDVDLWKNGFANGFPDFTEETLTVSGRFKFAGR